MRLKISFFLVAFTLCVCSCSTSTFAQTTSLYREDFTTNQELRFAIGAFATPSAISFSPEGVSTNIPAGPDSSGGLGVDPTIPQVDLTGTTSIEVVARADAGNQSDLIVAVREAAAEGQAMGEFFSFRIPASSFPVGGGFVTVSISPTSGFNGDITNAVLDGPLSDTGIQSPEGTGAHRYTVQSIEFVSEPVIPAIPGFDRNCIAPVLVHGPLSVSGTHIVDQNNNIVSFAGNSMFWSNTGFQSERFYSAGLVRWLQQDWNTNIIRAAMGVDEPGGYLTDPVNNLNRVTTVVDAAIENDMYVIIDWHSHHAEDFEEDAVQFFTQMAQRYGDTPHVIYEIYNEPITRDWTNTIKPYSEVVIAAIRAVDPDNLIIVGTPFFSQDVDVVSEDPIEGFDNIAYTFHFYAGTHGEELRERARTAIGNGLPLMVTEWGTVEATGDGAVDRESTQEWLEFMAENDLTHLNWSVTDLPEGASILRTDASPNGGWPDSDLTESGLFVREIIRDWNACVEVATVVGDFDENGIVDCDDLDGYVGNLGNPATGMLAALDIDLGGTLTLADANETITTLVVASNGVTGTFPGDLDCDGRVDVLNDAFTLISNLGAMVTSYADGDVNFSGNVDVLSDAFPLIGNLGETNSAP